MRRRRSPGRGPGSRWRFTWVMMPAASTSTNTFRTRRGIRRMPPPGTAWPLGPSTSMPAGCMRLAFTRTAPVNGCCWNGPTRRSPAMIATRSPTMATCCCMLGLRRTALAPPAWIARSGARSTQPTATFTSRSPTTAAGGWAARMAGSGSMPPIRAPMSTAARMQRRRAATSTGTSCAWRRRTAQIRRAFAGTSTCSARSPMRTPA